MKIIKIIALLLFSVLKLNGQTTVFSENFDSVITMTSQGNPGYNAETSYFSSAPACIRGQVDSAGVSTLTSPVFSTAGNGFVVLSFDHICKVSFFDSCLIEVSVDNGASWTSLDSTNSNYSGGSPIFTLISNFNAGCYSDWEFGNPASLSNSWWKHEVFDISALCGLQTSVQLRFRFRDNGDGMQGFYGWLIDNISIVAAPCELNAPSLQLTSFHPNGNTFGGGPWPLTVTVNDVNSGADTNSVWLYYSVSHNGPVASDSVNFIYTGGNTASAQFSGMLPAVNEGDTLCYYISASDECGNTVSTSQFCANIVFGISMPFSDNFDSGNPGWTDTTVSGSGWEWGTPAFGATTGAFTAPNAWDVNLAGPYAQSTDCRLYSPVFDFTGVSNAKLSFMHNYNVEAAWDGVRIDVSVDGGLVWNVLGTLNDPLGTNWYNDASVNSSMLPGWTASSPGWQEASYILSLFNNLPDVRFRYVFTSDAVIEDDGYSLDNFSIRLPADIDLGIDTLVLPPEVYAGSSVNIPVVITNYGMQTISSFAFEVMVNGSADTTQIINTIIAPGGSTTIFINVTVPADSFEVCGTIVLFNDTVSGNNIYCNTSPVVVVQMLPYSNTFETIVTGWQALSTDTVTQWQWGTPAYGATTGAFSGMNCWDINLVSGYMNNSNAFLYTPVFDVSTTDTIRIGFAHNFKTQLGRDGVVIQYEMNGSGIWINAGNRNDDNGLNWYNDTVLIVPQRSQFGGSSNGWQQSYIDLISDSSATMQFRFYFRSDNNFNVNDGYSIDDFYIASKPVVDAAIIASHRISGNAGLVRNPIVTIKNSGLQPLSGISVSYSINGSVSGSGLYSGTLLPGASDTLSLTSFTIPAGDFDFCASLIATGDSFSLNDTLCKQVKGVTTFAIPYSDDFEGTSNWSVVTEGAPSTNWELGMPAYGATSSTHSGNVCWDINLNSAYGNNALTYLISPYFDFSNAVFDTLKFWHNFNTENNWDGVRLEYDINLLGNWQMLGGWDGNSGGWMQTVLPLTFSMAADIVQFRFVFESDGVVSDDGYSIDDFEIISAAEFDIAVQSVVSPGLNVAAGVSVPASVNIYNAGLQPSAPFNIYYSLNGGPFSSQSVSTVIPSFTTLNVSLGSVIPLPGVNTLRVYTDMSNDLNRNNDTLDYVFIGVLTVVPPYLQDFESNSDGWISIPSSLGNSAWELGMPAFGSTSSAHSGSVCWDVNLSLPYGNGVLASLESPVFNLSTVTQSVLRFWMNFNTEPTSDGVQLQYTTDVVNYQPLGGFNDGNGVNWYNTSVMPTFLSPAWTGNSGGWLQAQYNTSFLDGQASVKFRFVFRSDINLVSDGFSIDDFEVDGVVGMAENNAESALIYPNPFDDAIYIFNAAAGTDYIIYSASGAKVGAGKVVSLNEKVDASHLTEGIYSIVLYGKNQTTVKRMIKQND